MTSPLRIVSTACWRFPIYSQSFIYQELTQLANAGHDLTFLYAELDGTHPLPEQFAPVWRARRQMSLQAAAFEEDYRYFQRRSSDRLNTLVLLLVEASGLSPAELHSHQHFRQGISYARIVEPLRPDYLHSYFFYEGSLFTFIASFLLGVPRGISCYSDHLLGDYVLKAVDLQIRHAHVVVATSRRIKDELLMLAPGVEPERIVVKPNAVNAQRFPLAHHVEPAPGEPFRLVCVSRFDRKKGLTYLLHAVRRLLDMHTRVELHLVGTIDPDQKDSAEYGREIESLIQRLGLGAVVHLEGRRGEAEVREFLARAHVFVAPFVEMPGGDKDGIPTTILEAMASGLPVVATDAGSITEVVRHGEDGVIVPQRDAQALANAVRALLDDATLRARLGASAAARARSAFDVDACEHVFHRALNGIAGGRRSAELSMPQPVPAFPHDMSLDVESRRPPKLHAATIKTVLERPADAAHVPAPDDTAAVGRTIIVVTYNNLVFNRLCIESVLANTRAVGYEIIVIDNASTDGTVEYLRALSSRDRRLRVTFNQENRGYAPAVNQGLALAKGDALVLLNNDTIVPEQWLARLLRHLDDPSVGLVGAVTNRSGNEAQIDAPYSTYGEFLAFARRLGPARLGQSFDIRTATMFCAAMRRDVYERVGGLDERFAVGMFEDDDYSMRVREAGYAVRCAEDTFVHHFGQASFGDLAARGEYGAVFHANRQKWEAKWGRAWTPYQLRENASYGGLIGEIRALVRETVPRDAGVAVISKGDPALLELDGRRAWHFPQNDRGEYAGFYPATSDEAIDMLERARSEGARFLVVPASAFWWLEHYGGFAEHLAREYRFVSPDPARAAIVDLR